MAIAKIFTTALLAGLVAAQTLTIPTRTGSIISLSLPSLISGSKDFGNKEFDRGRACETDVLSNGGEPVFILEDGASISNVIIGQGQVEGIECRGACTLKNVWFRRGCHYSIVLSGNGNVLVEGGGAKAAEIIYHKGRGNVTVKDFTAIDSTYLYRSCGSCNNNGGPRNVAVSNLKANNVKLVAGINSNYGDTASVTGSCGTAVAKVCQEYKGVNKGLESPKVSTTANCKGQLSLGAC
ncbi:Putative pectate lyase PlyH/PlyE, pectin lyase/virulence factor [Colletotrichum destructivum]|uniref:Pectate lyase n=1 Tax=Colletotrichum destructivum TaxID=34406 RepID=A0AAX4IPA6_9PEZI|nr:Putative pectate lyase PlyH/PlyE, pectin lyase/virulence factor [Colletotrichum destructivum]